MTLDSRARSWQGSTPVLPYPKRRCRRAGREPESDPNYSRGSANAPFCSLCDGLRPILPDLRRTCRRGWYMLSRVRRRLHTIVFLTPGASLFPLAAFLAALLAFGRAALPAGAASEQVWLALSDVHLDIFARSSHPSSYGFDTNVALLESAVAQMKRTVRRPRHGADLGRLPHAPLSRARRRQERSRRCRTRIDAFDRGGSRAELSHIAIRDRARQQRYSVRRLSQRVGQPISRTRRGDMETSRRSPRRIAKLRGVVFARRLLHGNASTAPPAARRAQYGSLFSRVRGKLPKRPRSRAGRADVAFRASYATRRRASGISY